MTRDPSRAWTLVLAAIDPTTAVMLALGGALMVASWITSWRVWHGANIPARSSYSPRQQLELRRKLPAATTAGTAVVIGALTEAAWGHRSAVTVIVIVACSVVGLSGAAVMASAGSRGRPRWAIPPDLRDHGEDRLLHRQ